MAKDIYPLDLLARLKPMSNGKKLAFLLLLCERMLPCLQSFSSDTGFDMQRYSSCLKLGWGRLEGKPELTDYLELSDECFNNAPDTECFDHVLTSAALDATFSIGHLMLFLSDNDAKHITEVAKLAYDTVALYVQRVASNPPISLSNETVVKHPLMKQEMTRQESDLGFVVGLSNKLTPVEVGHLRERSKQEPGLLSAATA